MAVNLTIVWKKIEELKPAEYNPRKFSDKELKKLKKSISAFGFVEPIVINSFPGRENVVIGGHMRLQAAKELNITKVPVVEVSLSPDKERALNLALNKIKGEWDEKKLIEALLELEKENEDILPLTGFEEKEIEYLLELQQLEKETIYASAPEDRLPDNKNQLGIEPGDIVEIDGKHRIICGDSTDPGVWRALLGETKIDLIVTSPPYNLDIKYGKYRDNKEYKEYIAMIEKVFRNAKDFLNKGRYVCVNIGRDWGPINMPAKYNQLLEEIGYVFFRDIYWIKPLGSARGTITTKNPFPRYYVPKVQTEIVQIYSFEEKPSFFNNLIVYKIGEEPHREKKERIPDLLLSKYIGNAWFMAPETALDGRPKEPFPVQLPFNCIRFFTFKEEVVLDPFLGSGTTIIAADQLGRKGYGIELDPNYVNLTVTRFKEYKPDAKIKVIKHANTEG